MKPHDRKRSEHANSAGNHPGDILLTVEGIAVDSAGNMMKVRDHLATLKAGEPIKTTVLRAGKVVELTGVVPWVVSTRALRAART